MNNIKSNKIEEINKENEVVKVLIDYKKDISIFNKNGLCYNYSTDSNNGVNLFNFDPRKFLFSHSDKSVYTVGIGPVKKSITTQILEMNEPYIAIKDNQIIEYYPLCTNDNIYLIKDVLEPSFNTNLLLTRNDLIEYLSNGKLWYNHFVNLSGKYLGTNINNIIPSELEILKSYRNNIKKYIDRYKDEITDEEFNNFINNCYNHLSLNLIPGNINLIDDNILLVKMNEKDISISKLSLYISDKNLYKLCIEGYQIVKYKDTLLNDKTKKKTK